MQIEQTTESSWRSAGRWVSNNVHYLGLIALLTGVGMLIATEVIASQNPTPQKAQVYWVWQPTDNTGNYVYGQIAGQMDDPLLKTSWTTYALGVMVPVGVLLGVGAARHGAKTAAHRRRITTLPATDGAAIERRCAQRDWITRAAVILSIAMLALCITAHILAKTTQVTEYKGLVFDDSVISKRTWYEHHGSLGGRIHGAIHARKTDTLYQVSTSPVPSLRGIYIPLMISGACATFCGLGCHTALAARLRRAPPAVESL
jgi:hypothetical protein